MQANFDHCAALVREADRDRFLATLFAPAEHRDALFALYAFNVEIARVRDVAREPLPGEIRLQWWREVLAGERDGEAAAHPVAAALRETLARYGLSAERLSALIDARAFDLYDDPMASFAQLESYARQTAGTVYEFAQLILTRQVNSVGTDAAMHAGIVETNANVIARLPRHLARGQLFIPLEELAEQNVTRDDVLAGRGEVALKIATAGLAIRARGHLLPLASWLRNNQTSALPAFLPLAPLRRWLVLMDRPNYNPLQPPEIADWLRQWRIWRAAKTPARIGFVMPLFRSN
jgi:phytoene synthase